MKRDNETTIQELKDLATAFARKRNWTKHHTPRNLASSIVIEAAELLEHFQWKEYSEKDKQDIADELGDILAYCFHLATSLNIDVSTVYRDKLTRAAKKYPVETFNASHDDEAEYIRIKQAYRARKQPGRENA